MRRLKQFWEWVFDGDPNRTVWDNYYSGRAKAYVLIVFGFIAILIIVFFVIWLDNYIRHNF